MARLEVISDNKRQIEDLFIFQVVMLNSENIRKSLDTFLIERVFFIQGYKQYELDIRRVKTDTAQRCYFSSIDLKKLGFKKHYPIKMLLQVKRAGFIRSTEYSTHLKMQ